MSGIIAKSITKLIQTSIRNVPLNPRQWKRELLQSQYRESKNKRKAVPRQYNTPHPPKDPPTAKYAPKVVHVGFEGPPYLPYAVFRPFQTPTDQLGPGAHKCEKYKNSEYFAFHRYSFVDLQRQSQILRQKGIESGNLRCVYDYETSSSSSSSSSSDDSDTSDSSA